METILIADPAITAANPAVPVRSAGSAAPDCDARRELADALADRDAADKAARAAKAIADRAVRAKDQAAAAVSRLKQDLDRVQANATESHALACAAALKAGKDPPECPVLPTINSAPYAVAMAHLAALDRAADELAAEYDRAAHAAGAAAARVATLADEIMFGEIRVRADEAEAAMELHWRLVDKLKGLIMLDEARPGGPRFRAFQEAFLERIDRQKVATARDATMIERHRYLAYIADLADQERRRWQDYRRRLTIDPAACFEATDDRRQ
jgi:hypothetical protein